MKYEITFYSYWAVGSGMGGGSKDAIVLKDQNGLPYIPGRTIKGLMRDAYLECGLSKEIDIFGSVLNDNTNNAGKLHFENAHLPNATTKELLKNKKLIKGLYETKTANRLDDNKQSEENALRKVEVCIPLTLEGEIKALDDITSINDYKQELIKTVKMLKVLGERRHRGMGRCIINFKEESDE